MRAIETTGKIDSEGKVIITHPLDAKNQTVKVIILIPDNEDIENISWANALHKNPSFDFLHDKAEDIYSLEDGQPVENEV